MQPDNAGTQAFILYIIHSAETEINMSIISNNKKKEQYQRLGWARNNDGAKQNNKGGRGEVFSGGGLRGGKYLNPEIVFYSSFLQK